MNKFRTIFLSYLLLITISFAQDKVKYDGYAEVGAQGKYKQIRVESFYRAKLEVSFDVTKKTEVQLDMRGNSEDENIEFHQILIKYDVVPGVKIKFGNIKKRYGLEEKTSREKLQVMNHSLVNSYLSTLGYASSDNGLQVILENDDREFTGGVYYNESDNATVIADFTEKDFIGLDEAGINLNYIHFGVEDIENGFTGNIYADYKHKHWENSLEVFYGFNPVETVYLRRSKDAGSVKFMAVKAMCSYEFKFDNEFVTGIEPVIQGCILIPDDGITKVKKTQLLMGANIYFDKKIRLMINGDMIVSNNRTNPDESYLTGSNVVVQVQVRW